MAGDALQMRITIITQNAGFLKIHGAQFGLQRLFALRRCLHAQQRAPLFRDPAGRFEPIGFQSDVRYWLGDASARVITVTRDGYTRFGIEVCSPDNFTRMRAGIETIGRDVRAQVIVRSSLADVTQRSAPVTPSRASDESQRRAQAAD